MSQIVINDILPRTRLTAILNQTEFNTNWTANAPSDVFVYLTPFGDAPDDAEQKLAYPVDYSVTLVGSQQDVQVILTLPCAAGDIVTIIRQTPADRQNLYSNTNFTPTMLNNDFGILTLVDQQAQMVDQIVGPRYNYSAAINTNSPTSTRDSIIPTLGPNQFWGMNDAGDEIVALDISDIGEGVFEIDTGLGLTGGPITSSGTISFAPMAPNTFWGNITGSIAVPTEVPTSYFLKSSDISGSQNSLLYFSSLNVLGTFGPAANSTLVTSAASVPSLSTTLPTTVQSNITQLGVQAIDLNMNNHWIHNLTDPTNPQDAATKAYVLSQTLGAFLPLAGGTMTGAINMGNFQINAMANPTSGQDAVTLSHLSGMLTSYLLKSGGTMTGNINMGSQYITNLLDPVNPQDAATRNYVDTVAIGLTVQASCYAATTTNLTATYANGASGIGATLTNSGALATFTVDGTTPPTNSRILVKNQSSLFQNGIYTLTNVGSGAVAWILTRATDYDQPSEIQPGDLIVINNGTTNAGTSFIETDSISVIGTDPIEFSQFTFSATAVLLKANNLFDVANTTIAFNNISPLTTKGDLIAYSTQNVRLGVGSVNGQILQVNSAAATGLGWSTASYPVTTTVNQILYSNATNTVVGLATAIGSVLVTSNIGTPSMLANPGSTGRMLQSVNGDIPAWSTAIYPSTAGTSGNVLTSDGTNWSSSPITVSSAALTRTNDTNVTVTLGGSPTTALLAATSLTLGWSGTLSGTRGGTGVNNGASTITVGGNFSMVGAFTFAGTLTGNTSVTFPTSGTLATVSQITTSNIDVSNGRLTLTSNTPVTTSDVLSATTLYFTPYKGNNIALYDGVSVWNIVLFTQISITVPATTSQMYDVFVYNNAGTATLELTAWTNDTTRATALTTQDGVYVKTGATTRRYLGSFRTTTISGQTEDSITKRYVWNYYNRRQRQMRVNDSTASWSYSTAAYRQVRATATNQLDMVIGVSEDTVFAMCTGAAVTSTAVSIDILVGIGLDSTSVNSATVQGQAFANTSLGLGYPHAQYIAPIAAGRHTLVWLERGAGVATQTWYGVAAIGGSAVSMGINGYLLG